METNSAIQILAAESSIMSLTVKHAKSFAKHEKVIQNLKKINWTTLKLARVCLSLAILLFEVQIPNDKQFTMAKTSDVSLLFFDLLDGDVYNSLHS